MKSANGFSEIYLHREPVDSRQSINGLTLIVEQEIQLSLFVDGLSVFFSKAIYRHKQLIKHGGVDALRQKETPCLRHKNRSGDELEKVVVEFSLKNPHLRQAQVSRQLNANVDIEISPSGVCQSRLVIIPSGSLGNHAITTYVPYNLRFI